MAIHNTNNTETLWDAIFFWVKGLLKTNKEIVSVNVESEINKYMFANLMQVWNNMEA